MNNMMLKVNTERLSLRGNSPITLLNRRQVVAMVGGLTVLAAGMPGSSAANDLGHIVRKAAPIIGGRRIPPLYAVAFIDPGIEAQQGQEATVAKYPLALVPQDMRTLHVAWRDRIRALNPNIVLCAYQISVEGTTVPGPGHDELRKIKEISSFIRNLDGSFRTINSRGLRLYDPRAREWRERFLDACSITLASYPYQGLFLDQYSVFAAHGVVPWEREEIKEALRATARELRKRHPDALLIANSAFDWPDLNGEMNENKKHNLTRELRSNSIHSKPELNLGLVLLEDDTREPPELRRMLGDICGHGALFSAAKVYQRVPWFPLYDEILALTPQ